MTFSDHISFFSNIGEMVPSTNSLQVRSLSSFKYTGAQAQAGMCVLLQQTEHSDRCGVDITVMGLKATERCSLKTEPFASWVRQQHKQMILNKLVGGS